MTKRKRQISRKKNRQRRPSRTQSRLGMEPLEAKCMLAGDVALTQNLELPEDVNGDEVVSPLDALEVINAMDGRASDSSNSLDGRRPMLDVDGNGVLSPFDIMMVVNRLNNGPNNGGPGGDDGGLLGGAPGRGGGPGGGGNNNGGGPGGGPGGGNNNGGGPGGGPGGGHHGGDEFPVRTIDGTGNNDRREDWGSTDIELLRVTTPEYGDGVSSPAGEDRPSAREVSNAIAAQDEFVDNDRGLTDLVWLWGQFIDHDIDLTENADPAEAFDIEVPTGDPWFDPFGTGEVTIGLNRSIYAEDSGNDLANPREQLNEITAFLDGSVVYGSDQERADALRSFEGGRLSTSEGDLLPFNVDGLSNAGGTSNTLFLAGDVRANENAALTSMHTLWVREHNRIADEISSQNSNLDDEEIYQRAKAIVTAELQVITYNEFLPALLGKDAIPEYEGYDPRVNPGISNVFSTAAYRFGHSMLSPELLRLNNDGTVIDAGNLPLQSAFFAPNEVIENDIDSLLLGAANQLAQEIDSMIVDDVRNFLFGPPGAGGFDLASLNIQRGRDHGLPDYNQARVDMGLEPIETFADLTSDPELQAELQALYGSVDNIDVWVGGLAEDHVDGASVGEFVHTVLVDQFTRIRDGDSFWYEEIFSGRQLRQIENTSLSDVIRRNTDVRNIQDNVFMDSSDRVPLIGNVLTGTSDVVFANPARVMDAIEVDDSVAINDGRDFNTPPSRESQFLRDRDATPETRSRRLDVVFASMDGEEVAV